MNDLKYCKANWKRFKITIRFRVDNIVMNTFFTDWYIWGHQNRLRICVSLRWMPNCPLRGWSWQVRSTSGTRDLGRKGTREEVAALKGGRKQKKASTCRANWGSEGTVRKRLMIGNVSGSECCLALIRERLRPRVVLTEGRESRDKMTWLGTRQDSWWVSTGRKVADGWWTGTGWERQALAWALKQVTKGKRTIGSHASVPQGQSEAKEEMFKRVTRWERRVERWVVAIEPASEAARSYSALKSLVQRYH